MFGRMEAGTLKEKGVFERRKTLIFQLPFSILFVRFPPRVERLCICRFYLKNLFFFPRNGSTLVKKKTDYAAICSIHLCAIFLSFSSFVLLS